MSIKEPVDYPLALGRRTPRFVRWTLVSLALVLALSLGGAISLSPPFQNGATRLFGKVVDGVKDHPRATLALSLGGAAALWLFIGTLAAGQEWRARKLRGGRADQTSPAAKSH